MNFYDNLEEHIEKTSFITEDLKAIEYDDAKDPADAIGRKAEKGQLASGICNNSYEEVTVFHRFYSIRRWTTGC